tara:strand:+ start:44451 stop:47282 length:2832 start_codon:yes stop_codon:yes gene_type:complete
MRTQRVLLTVLLFTSGLCGISYEILYGRLLGNIIGDQFVVSTAVLLTFMLGIGLGALHAHRLWARLWLIEGCIGLYAVIFAYCLPGIESLLYNYLPTMGTNALISIAAAALLLLIPAFAIGVSLPLFAGYAHRLRPTGGYFARSYGLYNFSAALTVILIEFWLIRAAGIKNSVYVIGALNVLVAIGLSAFFKDTANTAPARKLVSRAGFSPRVVAALAISSVGSAIFQLTAIRLSELLFGPYRETFAYVLCIVLLGIAIGSYLVQRFRIGFVPLMLANMAALAWALGALSWLMHQFADLYPYTLDSYWTMVALKFTTIAVVTLGPAVTFGATIPALLLTRQHAEGISEVPDHGAARSPGYLLYVASIANAAGFLLMFWVLHQRLDYGELLLCVAFLSGLSLVVIGAPRRGSLAGGIRRLALPFSVLILLAGSTALARFLWNEELLYQGHMAFHSPDLLSSRVGKHATSERYKGEEDVLSISTRRGTPYFMINGKISIRLDDAAEKVVGAIGGIFATDHRRAMVLGVGSGATAGSVGLIFDKTEAVEISGIILDNLPRLKEYNFDLANMSNVALIHDDAIHAVRAARADYSLILNTVTSPLFFRSSKLYSTEFLQEVKNHLAPGGLYMTWLDSRVGDRGADIMIETVSRMFDHCGLAQLGSSYLLLLCSDTPVMAHHPYIVAQQDELATYFREQHRIDPAGLAYQLLHTDIKALRNPAGAPLNTIDRPVLAFEMTKVSRRNIAAFQKRIVLGLQLESLGKAFQHFDWGLQPMIDSIARVSGKNLYYQAWKMELTRFSRIYQEGLEAERAGDCENAVDLYRRALEIDYHARLLHLRLGRCYEMLGRHNEALAAYEREQESNPANHQVTMLQGRTLLWLERYENALSKLAQVPESKRDGAYYYLLGRVLEGLGNEPQAREAYALAKSLEGSLRGAAEAALKIKGET